MHEDDEVDLGPINPFERIRQERRRPLESIDPHAPPGLEFTAGGFEWPATLAYRAERPLLAGSVGFVLGVPLIFVALLYVLSTMVANGVHSSGDLCWMGWIPTVTALVGAGIGHGRATGVRLMFRLEGRRVAVGPPGSERAVADIEQVTVKSRSIRVGDQEFVLDEPSYHLDWLRKALAKQRASFDPGSEADVPSELRERLLER